MVDESVEERKQRLIQYLKDRGELTRPELEKLMGEEVPTSTLLRDLADLVDEDKVTQVGQSKATSYVLASQSELEKLWQSPTTHVETSTGVIGDEEPLVQVKITNPIAYFKHWWQKVVGNEGIKVKLSVEVKPLTAIALVLVVTALSLGITTVGTLLKYLPFYSRVQQFVTAPDNSRATAMEGRLYMEAESGKYYLFTANMDEAVVVAGDDKVDLSWWVDKQVVITGKYNDQTNILAVETVAEVKLNRQRLLAPVISPVLMPIPTPSPIASGSATSK